LSLAEAFEFGFDRAFWLLLIVFLLSLWPLHAMRQGLIKRHCYDG